MTVEAHGYTVTYTVPYEGDVTEEFETLDEVRAWVLRRQMSLDDLTVRPRVQEVCLYEVMKGEEIRTSEPKITEEHRMDIVFDIDGTLSDPEHRRHLVANRPKPDWEEFQRLEHLDPAIEPVAALARTLAAAHRIVLCTGRMESSRGATEAWLAKHRIPYQGLYMRPQGDFRSDEIVKGELLDAITADGYEIMVAFDDRQRVVDMWRSRGVLCCQVAPGDF
jgi:hypothetical protein